jgi:radical SAM protein with 4Fe4S-binding SPASM domain
MKSTPVVIGEVGGSLPPGGFYKMIKINKLKNIFLKGYYYSHQKLDTPVIPMIQNIESTNACGMNCIMCPRRYMIRKIGFMDINLFEKIVKQLKGNTRLALHHFGDPLLHPKIGEMIKICHKYGIKASLSTNPTSLTEKKSKELIESKLDYLHLSLDGATRETYKKIRGKNADYDKALKGIEIFLRKKKEMKSKLPHTKIAIIKMKETEKEIEIFKEKWKKIEGIDEVQIKEFITWDGTMEDIKKLEQESSHKVKRNKYYPCYWPWGKLTVLWDGRVVACCFDSDAKCVLGDLNKQTLHEIWNSENMEKFRKQQIENSFPKGHLCSICKEREGFKPSKIFPLNMILEKRLNFLNYYNSN